MYEHSMNTMIDYKCSKYSMMTCDKTTKMDMFQGVCSKVRNKNELHTNGNHAKKIETKNEHNWIARQTYTCDERGNARAIFIYRNMRCLSA